MKCVTINTQMLSICSKNSWWDTRSKLEKLLIASASCLVVLLVLVTSFLASSKSNNRWYTGMNMAKSSVYQQVSPYVCLTPACVKAGSYFLNTRPDVLRSKTNEWATIYQVHPTVCSLILGCESMSWRRGARNSRASLGMLPHQYPERGVPDQEIGTHCKYPFHNNQKIIRQTLKSDKQTYFHIARSS